MILELHGTPDLCVPEHPGRGRRHLSLLTSDPKEIWTLCALASTVAVSGSKGFWVTITTAGGTVQRPHPTLTHELFSTEPEAQIASLLCMVLCLPLYLKPPRSG